MPTVKKIFILKATIWLGNCFKSAVLKMKTSSSVFVVSRVFMILFHFLRHFSLDIFMVYIKYFISSLIFSDLIFICPIYGLYKTVINIFLLTCFNLMSLFFIWHIYVLCKQSLRGVFIFTYLRLFERNFYVQNFSLHKYVGKFGMILFWR